MSSDPSGIQPPRKVRYELTISRPGGLSETVEVDDRPLMVGRARGCAIHAEEPAISRRHCLIAIRGGRLTIQDQGSANGTLVNGQRVTQTVLRSGDVIVVGSISLKVQVAGATGLYGVALRRRKARAALSESEEETSPGSNGRSLLEMLDRLSVAFTSPDDEATVARTLLELLFELIPPIERATLLALNGRSQAPRIIAILEQAGVPTAAVGGPSPAVVQRVLSANAPFHSLEVDNDDDLSEDERAGLDGIQAVLCAPVSRGGQPAGVLYADVSSKTTRLSPSTATLFEGFAKRVGPVLWSSRQRSQERGGGAPAELEGLLEEANSAADECRLELAVRLNELEALRDSRESLSLSLVQDIRAMTDSIGLDLARLRGSLTEATGAMRSVEKISLENAHIVTIVEDVVAAVQMENGVYGLSTQAVSATEIIEGTWDRALAKSRALGVRLELGEVEKALEVVADHNVVGRIMDNLTLNAIRSAGPEGTVTLSARSDGQYAEFSLVDASTRPRSSSTWKALTDTHPPRRSSTWRTIRDRERSSSAPPPSLRGTGLHFCRLAAKGLGGSLRVVPGRATTQWILSLPVADDQSLEITQTT